MLSENRIKLDKQIAILETVTGSYLYGTNDENSDKDYIGIFVGNMNNILGLEKIEHVKLFIKDKDLEGKNTNKAIDRNFYELKKYINNLLRGSPNLLELLFVKEEHIKYINNYGQLLLANKHLFLTKKTIKGFLGYSNNCLKRFEKDNTKLKDAYHAVRLYDEVIEYVTNGYINFPLKHSNRLIKIKNGTINLNLIKNYINDAKDHAQDFTYEFMSDCNGYVKLPNDYNYNAIQDFMIDMYKKYYLEINKCLIQYL